MATHEDDVEMAAGGLVWCREGGEVCLGVVYREKHRDWSLPKGKQEEGELLKATAVREAMEETGWQVAADSFAGAFDYLKNGSPKVVLMWHMTRLADRYDRPAPPAEIDRVVWLTPAQAMDRLTHEVERQFLRRALASGSTHPHPHPHTPKTEPTHGSVAEEHSVPAKSGNHENSLE